MKNSMLQDMLGMSAEDAAVDTNVDIVFAIDGTGSMQRLRRYQRRRHCRLPVPGK